MRQITAVLLLWSFLAASGAAEEVDSPAAITIYNQQFAVVRQPIKLELNGSTGDFTVTNITSRLEPDSVVLRSLDSGKPIQILEQNYRNDPVSEALLLSLNEGKTIDFLTPEKKIVQGKIIRSGYRVQYVYSPYNREYQQPQPEQPIIEVDGKLQFTLPGTPMFPALGDDTILKPTLTWKLASTRQGSIPAEVSYVTAGMSWHADYNIVAPPTGNRLVMVGWVTLQNDAGKVFRNAKIKLMAGDVNKVQEPSANYAAAMRAVNTAEAAAPPVKEKAFDEFHLYTLERPTTLHDRETKQVEFVRAGGIDAQSLYVYDGLKTEYGNYAAEYVRNNESYGTQSNPKVWVMQQFKNTKDNGLGIPLPAGRVRFYRQDEDGQLEFTGENVIDHTPQDETLRLYTGNAFDIVGERRRTSYHINGGQHSLDESFEIKLRNHKKSAVEVRVVEHLYRWSNWDITDYSDNFRKLDSRTIEFPVNVAANSEKTVTYTAHYSW